ncbi:sensor histidine kinase [Lipingzhangella sp. LS1_29]|uniref:Sensor histidine kinase n=1 Tax=Lipingzhangella rawalii TaxID=2055835 RepID=A0ABU2H3G8_9ACTN|nr:sensor histidine kinase [Lipingzhangella rawalii]MDS1269847.1 sensor histidine kinase [Lipingzhangella rawalii]
MRRFTPEEWSGVAMLAVCVGIGAPVALGPIDPHIPLVAWLLVYAATLGAVVGTAINVDHPRVQSVTYAAAVVLSWCVLLTVPNPGMLAILLVVIAAFGCYVLGLRANLLVVALNSGVITVAWVLSGRDTADVLLSVGFYTMIQLAALLSVTALLREQRMRAELTEAHVELQATGALLEESTRTAERLRISRELHDLIGHQLTVLTLELEAARHRQGEAVQAHIERANDVARGLLADVRSTVSTLRTESSTDLATALRNVGRDVPGLDIGIEVAENVRADEEQTAALIRATQEVVTNTLKHAEARELWIDVTQDDEAIHLTAVDDGKGAPGVTPGNGLRGLAERFDALGGRVDCDGTSGFRVSARVPVR